MISREPPKKKEKLSCIWGSAVLASPHPCPANRWLSLQCLPCDRCGTKIPEAVTEETVKLAPEGHKEVRAYCVD